jgi:hypothetical protein
MLKPFILLYVLISKPVFDRLRLTIFNFQPSTFNLFFNFSATQSFPLQGSSHS